MLTVVREKIMPVFVSAVASAVAASEIAAASVFDVNGMLQTSHELPPPF